MRARYYDPKLKRFLNRDVIRGDIQDGQTFNRYAFVNGNPVSYIDPLGLMKCETEGVGNGVNQRTRLLDKPVAGDNIGINLRPSATPSTPDFIVSTGGTAIVVPKGSVGPGSVNTGKGFSYLDGAGGNGLNRRVTGLKIMDPTGRYPDGYVVYMNKNGQTVNPLTGQTTRGKSDP